MKEKKIKKTPVTLSFKNQFLIATTLIQDDLFKQSVVYICEHNEEGAIGLMVNHPVQYPLQYIFDQMNIEVKVPVIGESPLLLGGPMHQERGFVIHRNTETAWRSSLKMSEALSVTTSHDVLEAIAAGTGPSDKLVILGYAAWEGGQLEKELADNAWLLCPMPEDYSLLFKTPFEDRWKSAAALLGINMRYFSTDIGHA